MTSSFPTNPNEEQRQQQRQAVFDSDVVYEWRCHLREGGKFFFSAVACGMGTIASLLLYYFTGDFIGFSILVFVTAIVTTMTYHLICLDFDYRGQITSKGIIEHKTEVVPDIFYKINRWMGYIGAVTCALAAIYRPSCVYRCWRVCFDGFGSWF
ncbi:hypothetical protein L4C34_04435 [Vibrio profundum]|uniref:hypothetical protein n=1 Tax=Vibrio profundum TaxID=2910247 RepID=UPI003D11F043